MHVDWPVLFHPQSSELREARRLRTGKMASSGRLCQSMERSPPALLVLTPQSPREKHGIFWDEIDRGRGAAYVRRGGDFQEKCVVKSKNRHTSRKPLVIVPAVKSFAMICVRESTVELYVRESHQQLFR
jgi:hypothetical protein